MAARCRLIGMGIKTGSGNAPAPVGSCAADVAQNKREDATAGAARTKSNDFWDGSEEGWIGSVHVDTRLALAIPFGTKGSPEPRDFSGRRVAEFQFVEDEITERDDTMTAWEKRFAHASLRGPWVGITKFELVRKIKRVGACAITRRVPMNRIFSLLLRIFRRHPLTATPACVVGGALPRATAAFIKVTRSAYSSILYALKSDTGSLGS